MDRIASCKFNLERDIEQTVPNLSVDIAEVMATHVVASTGDSSPYSKETDVNEVGHYLTDKIQTAIAAYRLGKSMSAAAASPASTNPSTSPEAK